VVVETSTKRSVEPVTLGAPRPVCGGRIGQLERSGRRRGGRFRDRWTKPRTRQVTAGRVPLLQAVGRSLGVGAPPFDGAHPIRLALAVDAVAMLQCYGYQRATNRRSLTGFLRAPVDVVYGDPVSGATRATGDVVLPRRRSRARIAS